MMQERVRKLRMWIKKNTIRTIMQEECTLKWKRKKKHLGDRRKEVGMTNNEEGNVRGKAIKWISQHKTRDVSARTRVRAEATIHETGGVRNRAVKD